MEDKMNDDEVEVLDPEVDVPEGLEDEAKADDVFVDGVRQLRPEYHKHGLVQRVVWREGEMAIAEVCLKSGRETGHEVWVVHQGGERVIGGVTVPASEFPPSSGEWGRTGWSVGSREDADAKVLAVKAARAALAQERAAGE